MAPINVFIISEKIELSDSESLFSPLPRVINLYNSNFLAILHKVSLETNLSLSTLKFPSLYEGCNSINKSLITQRKILSPKYSNLLLSFSS